MQFKIRYITKYFLPFFLISFFIFHLFGGDLGLISFYKLKQLIYVQKNLNHEILIENLFLEHQNDLFDKNVNSDYLECLLLNDLYKIDPEYNIIIIES